MNRILLAYSGGLDTTVAIPWLREQYDAEVIAVTVDLGQGLELASDPRTRAGGRRGARARRRRARRVRARLHPAGAAGGRGVRGSLSAGDGAGRPLIAQRLVDIARMEGASAIAHGCTGVHNDQVRLEASIRALDPVDSDHRRGAGHGHVAPRRRSSLRGSRRVPVPDSTTSPYSIDTNLWGRAIASGGLEDAWVEPPEEIYTLTRSPQESPDSRPTSSSTSNRACRCAPTASRCRCSS